MPYAYARHEAARALAGAGFRVFPIYPIGPDGTCTCTAPGEPCRGGSPGKHPMPGAPHGFHDATSDVSKVDDWFRATPGDDEDIAPNVGLATGGGFWVLDVDPKNGGLASLSALEQEHGELPRSHRIRTGSGGWHYYFAAGELPVGCRTNVRRGIDTRGEGGYVVTAPSNHVSGGTYEVETPTSWEGHPFPAAPGWLHEVLTRPEPKTVGEFRAATDEDPGDEGRRVLLDLQAALPFIDSEDRDRWLRIGMALKRGGDEYGAPRTFFAVWSAWASTSEKFDPADARRVWDSIDERADGVTVRAVFGMAMSAGWANGSRSAAVSVAADELEILPPLEGPDFPEHLLEVDGLLGDLAAWINTATPRRMPVATLAASIVALGCLMGRRYRSETDLRTNIYAVLVAPSGSGKNGARTCFMRLFEAVGAMRHLGGNWKSGPAILSDLKEQPARLYLSDEFGDTLAAMTSPRAPAHLARALSVLKEVFSNANGPFLPESAASKDLREEAQTIYEPHLCVYGTTTSEPFFGAMTSRQVEDGFANRLLVFPIPDRDPIVNGRPTRDVPSRLVERMRHLLAAGRPDPAAVGNLAAISAETGHGPAVEASPARCVPYDEAAAVYFAAFEKRLCKSYTNLRKMLGGNSVPSLWGRAHEHAVKVAMIRAIGRDPRDPVITEVDARWSVELVSWTIRSFEAAIHYRLADSRTESSRQRVLSLIAAAPEGIERSSLMRRSKLSKREMDAALEDLTESRLVAVREGENTTGPKSRVYFSRTELG